MILNSWPVSVWDSTGALCVEMSHEGDAEEFNEKKGILLFSV